MSIAAHPADDPARHSWENPGAFEVSPGVHRIPLPLPGDGLKAVNIYAIADGDEVVLIDGGWALTESAELLGKGLESIGYGLDRIREFLCTHLHRDHYTQAIAIRRAYGGKVSVGAGEQACLDLLRRIDHHPDVERMRTAGAADIARELAAFHGEHDLENWEDPDRWLPNGVDIELTTRSLRVIATPGHTRGHVVFHDPEHNALFAGDHVLPHITPSIGVELNRPPSPLRDYLSSLELIRALPDTRLFPAHGPVADSVHHRIDELLTHHEERLTDTATAVEKGATTGFDAARALGWTRRKRRYDDLDFFNRILAVHETMAHLAVLVERGVLTRTELAGVAHFAVA
ncbi:MAG: MBL fold metallo-hydrolase [Actinomycetota bacterium]|nr:MBL fold metallo-hydrolase [Actinomycetota bacterium]